MAWYEGRPRLKLTGHRSAEEVRAVFESFLVDVAYAVEVTPDAVFVAADDPRWPADPEDYEWLCSIVRGTLADSGITGVALSFLPGADPTFAADQSLAPDPRRFTG